MLLQMGAFLGHHFSSYSGYSYEYYDLGKTGHYQVEMLTPPSGCLGKTKRLNPKDEPHCFFFYASWRNYASAAGITET